MLTPLIQTLRELVDTHHALVNNAERKKESLIKDDLESLSRLLKEESQLVRQLGKLEEERIYQVKQYVARLGLVAEEITISQLIQLIPEQKEKEVVKEIASNLHSVIEEVKKKNELNTKLIQDALHYVNQSLDVMLEPDDELTYQGSADTEGSHPSITKRSFFDTKA